MPGMYIDCKWSLVEGLRRNSTLDKTCYCWLMLVAGITIPSTNTHLKWSVGRRFGSINTPEGTPIRSSTKGYKDRFSNELPGKVSRKCLWWLFVDSGGWNEGDCRSQHTPARWNLRKRFFNVVRDREMLSESSLISTWRSYIYMHVYLDKKNFSETISYPNV